MGHHLHFTTRVLRSAGLGLLVAVAVGACSTSPSAPSPIASYAEGPITEAQYVAIVREVHACMADKGYEVDEVAKRMDGVTYGFSFSGGSAGQSSNGQTDLVDCESQFGLMEAELAFQDQTSLTGAAREAAFADLSSCMEAAGIGGVSSADTAQDVQDRMAQLTESGADDTAAVSCWTQFSAQLFGATR